MRVLWMAITPSLYDETKEGGWIASLERIMRKYCPGIQLGITFEYNDNKFKVERDNVTYYPIKISRAFRDVLKMKFNGNDNWYLKKPLLLKIIEDFKPNVIHCFGSEWNWGLISQSINIPVVIHMQGFVTIYDLSAKFVQKRQISFINNMLHPRRYLQRLIVKSYQKRREEIEREIMSTNHYFMGRTNWDNDIVKFFSPDSTYYYCPEAIRPEIYNCPKRWIYRSEKKMRIVTITSAGTLKGNGMVLLTARILKELGVDFEWRVAGNMARFTQFEKSNDIRHEDVNIKLLGMISAQDIACELANADIYVHPSIIDNSPNSLCEAQLIGCPVVATYVGGIPQIVQDGKTGVLYPYNEPYTLAFTLIRLKDSREKMEYLSTNELTISKERHNPAELCKRLIKIYEDIISTVKDL